MPLFFLLGRHTMKLVKTSFAAMQAQGEGLKKTTSNMEVVSIRVLVKLISFEQ